MSRQQEFPFWKIWRCINENSQNEFSIQFFHFSLSFSLAKREKRILISNFFSKTLDKEKRKFERIGKKCAAKLSKVLDDGSSPSIFTISQKLFNWCFFSDGSCPAISMASTLTQTELLQELTNDCRYDKMVRPPGEFNASDPTIVVSRAYIYTIKSNMAKTLVIIYSNLLSYDNKKKKKSSIFIVIFSVIFFLWFLFWFWVECNNWGF